MVDAQGVASFALLRGRVREGQAFVWAFDLLELEGEDLRRLPLERRKRELKRWCAGSDPAAKQAASAKKLAAGDSSVRISRNCSNSVEHFP